MTCDECGEEEAVEAMVDGRFTVLCPACLDICEPISDVQVLVPVEEVRVKLYGKR